MLAFPECRTRAVHSQIRDIFATCKMSPAKSLSRDERLKIVETLLREFIPISKGGDNKYRDVEVNILAYIE